MQPIIILHSNDIHGRIDGLARIATLVARTQAENPGVPVLYLDAGDSEETTNRLSNLTKGAAMHRLLRVAGCAAATVGNAAVQRYGADVLPPQAAAGGYPLLLANLRMPDGSPLPGVQSTALLTLGPLRLGVIGVTAEFSDYEQFFALVQRPALPLIRECAAALRQDGADAVILLSHLGLTADRTVAAGLQDDVLCIIGGHTHDLLPEGERIGAVTVAQAGQFAEGLGRIDLLWDGAQLQVVGVCVLPITEDISADPRLLAEAAAIEVEVEHFLATVVGELTTPLEWAAERECGVGNLIADALREHMEAEVGLVTVGQAITAPLAAGPLRRLTLWDACDSSANPGAASLTGEQLLAVVRKGLDPAFAAATARPLRGRARGLVHLSGAHVAAGRLWIGNAPVDPTRTYRVAATDWELEPYGGYVDPAWALQCDYDMRVILREALEAYLVQHRPVAVPLGRLDGTLGE